MNAPGTTPHDQCADAGTHIPRSPQDETCDLCGDPMPPNPDVADVTGLWICTPCIEASL